MWLRLPLIVECRRAKQAGIRRDSDMLRAQRLFRFYIRGGQHSVVLDLARILPGGDGKPPSDGQVVGERLMADTEAWW